MLFARSIAAPIRINRAVTTSFALLCLMMLQGAASQTAPNEPLGAAPQSGWEFTVTPYLWLSGLEGEVGVFPDLQPVDVDLSFGDVLDNLKFAGMVAFAARKERFVALVDITYVHIGTSRDVGIRDPEFLEAELDSKTFASTVAAGWRAIDGGSMFLDILAGLRISAVDTELALTGPVQTRSGDGSETWVDPVVAARFHAPLGDRWAISLYGDVGGLGVNSDVTWQLLGSVQLNLSRHWRLAAGYRHYEIDFEDEGFVYDVSMSGPIIGAIYSF